jgi:hypothetical protein
LLTQHPPVSVQRDEGVLHDLLSRSAVTDKAKRQPDQVGGVPTEQDSHRVIAVENNLRRRHRACRATFPRHGRLRQLPAHTPKVARDRRNGDTNPLELFHRTTTTSDILAAQITDPSRPTHTNALGNSSTTGTRRMDTGRFAAVWPGRFAAV